MRPNFRYFIRSCLASPKCSDGIDQKPRKTIDRARSLREPLALTAAPALHPRSTIFEMPELLQKLLSYLVLGTVSLLQADKNTDKISGKSERN